MISLNEAANVLARVFYTETVISSAKTLIKYFECLIRETNVHKKLK